MPRGRSLTCLLRSPSARAAAALGAYLLAAQTAGLGLLLAEPAAACCCRQSGEKACRCRMCTHDRAAEAGQPQVETCQTRAPGATADFPDSIEPPAAQATSPAPAPDRPTDPAPPRAPGQGSDVPEPPPRAAG